MKQVTAQGKGLHPEGLHHIITFFLTTSQQRAFFSIYFRLTVKWRRDCLAIF